MSLKVGIAGYGVVGKRRRECVDRHLGMELVAVCDRSFSYDEINDGDVNFTPVVICENYIKEELTSLEKLIKSRVDNYRIRNPNTNRRLEWFQGIKFEDLKNIILQAHEEFDFSSK